MNVILEFKTIFSNAISILDKNYFKYLRINFSLTACMKSTISRDEYKESFKRHDYFNKIQENQNFLNYRTFLTTESYEPQNF